MRQPNQVVLNHLWLHDSLMCWERRPERLYTGTSGRAAEADAILAESPSDAEPPGPVPLPGPRVAAALAADPPAPRADPARAALPCTGPDATAGVAAGAPPGPAPPACAVEDCADHSAAAGGQVRTARPISSCIQLAHVACPP